MAGTQELIKEANDRKLSTESNLALEEAKLQSLRAEIGKSTKTLKDIKDNINLFPMEIAGFVKQGSQHILQYILLSIIPMAIIVTVMLKLFENSENMLAFFTNNSNISVLEFLISRIPYVAISATIVGVCYSICEVLLTEIVSINRRRQELYKVSIIASDVSQASMESLDLDEMTRYELRTQTKMELLKEHLKVNVGNDFTYTLPRRHTRGAAVPSTAAENNEHGGIDLAPAEGQ